MWLGGVIVAVVVGGLEAQELAGTRDGVAGAGSLEVGDAVYVTDIEGNRTLVRIAAVSSAGLTGTRENGAASAWRREEIAEIERRDALTNGIWIGVAIGWGVYMVTCHQQSDSPGGLCPPIAPYAPWYTGSLVLGGAVLGYVFDAHMTRRVYRAPTPVSVGVSSLVSGGGAGVQVSVGW